jgi:hypothetical protein
LSAQVMGQASGTVVTVEPPEQLKAITPNLTRFALNKGLGMVVGS